MEEPPPRRRQFTLAALFGVVTVSAVFVALARDVPTLAGVAALGLLALLGIALVRVGARWLQHPEGGVIGCAGLVVAGLGMFLLIFTAVPAVMLLLGMIVYRVFGKL